MSKEIENGQLTDEEEGFYDDIEQVNVVEETVIKSINSDWKRKGMKIRLYILSKDEQDMLKDWREIELDKMLEKAGWSGDLMGLMFKLQREVKGGPH